MSCETRLQNDMLYTVIVKESVLLFFTKTKTYTNLTKEKVKQLRVPWCKILRGEKVPIDVYPTRII